MPPRGAFLPSGARRPAAGNRTWVPRSVKHRSGFWSTYALCNQKYVMGEAPRPNRPGAARRRGHHAATQHGAGAPPRREEEADAPGAPPGLSSARLLPLPPLSLSLTPLLLLLLLLLILLLLLLLLLTTAVTITLTVAVAAATAALLPLPRPVARRIVPVCGKHTPRLCSRHLQRPGYGSYLGSTSSETLLVVQTYAQRRPRSSRPSETLLDVTGVCERNIPCSGPRI